MRPATDPGQTEYAYLERRSIAENVVACAFFLVAFVAPVLAASALLPTVPRGAGGLARASSSAREVEAMVGAALRESAALFARIREHLSSMGADGGADGGAFAVDDGGGFWSARGIRARHAACADALDRAAFEAPRALLPFGAGRGPATTGVGSAVE